MARRFASRFPRTSVGTRRKTEWDFGPGGTGVTSLSATGSTALGSSIQLTEKATIVRLRGRMNGFLTIASSGGDGFHGALGIGVFNLPAIVAGVASLPTPLTELAWDGWLYHQFFDVHAHSAVEAEFNDSTTFDYEVDSKAMRIMEATDQALLALVEVVEIGTATMNIFFESRVLFKLA